jgi:dTDP-4-amino-4,6-dideoxygalactose transaminase
LPIICDPEAKERKMNAPVITMIPQADPGAGYRAQKAEIDAAVARALASGWYILGKEGAAFEEEYAAWLGTRRAIGCANGTDALALILRGLGIGPGMSVATVSHTAVATVSAIEMVGATPLLLDIDPDTYTMDPDELLSVIDHPPPGLPPLRAVIPVHIYGQASDLEPMLEATRAAGIALIEDCAQCHRLSAFTPPRISARLAMAACWPRMMKRWRTASRPFGNMAGRNAISATWSA